MMTARGGGGRRSGWSNSGGANGNGSSLASQKSYSATLKSRRGVPILRATGRCSRPSYPLEDRPMRLPRLLLTLGSAFALVLVFAQSALADPRDFYLNNNSAVDIAQVYVMPTEFDSWGDDILGSQVLPSGQMATVTFKNF